MNTIELENYISVARVSDCPADQMENFLAADIWLQPKQLDASAAARECDDSDGPIAVGFGGARGGGKSHWLLAQMGADDCQRMPGLKCLLLRKVGKSNLENFEDLRHRVFPKLPHLFTASKNTVTFDNGSRIIAGHYQHESDIDSYLGLEYDVIGIEEATTLTQRKYKDISTCCRTSKPGWRPRIYATANPGGVGHTWFKKLFVDPSRARKAEGGRDAAPSASAFSSLPEPSTLDSRLSTVFISATVHDNRYVNPEYIKILERLNGWQKRAWLDGDWDIAAGQFFSNFRRDVHVLTREFDRQCVTDWFCSMDYGYNHYTVVLLGARDGDGNIYVVDEHFGRRMLPDEHAKAIDRIFMRNCTCLEYLSRFSAGPDCFSTQYTGVTIAKQYAELGIYLSRSRADRVQGWAEVLRRLGDPDRGVKPTLFIDPRCKKLIETLPTLMHDPNHPEDVLKVDIDQDGDGGDDAADALRYLICVPQTKVVKLGW
jgi:phage terminase large subunit